MLALRPPAAFRGDVGTEPTLIRLTPYATLCPSTVRPSLPAVALLSAPAGGTRRQFRRTSSIAFGGEQPGSGVGKFATPAKLLLAAGAITLPF